MHPTRSISRRSFLEYSTRLAMLMGLGAEAIPALAEAVTQLAAQTARVLWLQGQSCSGCSVALLNSHPLTPDLLLTSHLSLGFHQTLSSATGDKAVDAVNQIVTEGGYVLAVEGSVPAGMPEACVFGDEPFAKQVVRAARNAKLVLAVGSCAAFGGIPAAMGNPTGAVSLTAFLRQENVPTPLIAIPGCPTHPDWIVGVIAHCLKFGLPELDEHRRPRFCCSRLIHDQCPRFADYERERFATTFGEDGCLFKLGCAGPVTHADCPLRLWNSGANYCIKAGAPCIGCASKEFALRRDYAFYTKPSARKTGEAA